MKCFGDDGEDNCQPRSGCASEPRVAALSQLPEQTSDPTPTGLRQTERWINKSRVKRNRRNLVELESVSIYSLGSRQSPDPGL